MKWAESAGSGLHVAIVARPEIIDPEKIGVLMAQNRGATGDVFTSEVAAIAWLDSRSGPACDYSLSSPVVRGPMPQKRGVAR